MPDTKPNIVPTSASDVYDQIEQQFSMAYKHHINQLLDNPDHHFNLSDRQNAVMASTGIVLAALQITVERINRGDYDDNAINAVTEVFCTFLNSEFSSTRDLLTHIRDSMVQPENQKKDTSADSKK